MVMRVFFLLLLCDFWHALLLLCEFLLWFLCEFVWSFAFLWAALCARWVYVFIMRIVALVFALVCVSCVCCIYCLILFGHMCSRVLLLCCVCVMYFVVVYAYVLSVFIACLLLYVVLFCMLVIDTRMSRMIIVGL